jgi:hypothetical protein
MHQGAARRGKAGVYPDLAGLGERDRGLAQRSPFFGRLKMKVQNARLRHGHAPGHVRDTFVNAVDEFLNWKPGEAEPVVEFEVNYEPRMQMMGWKFR